LKLHVVFKILAIVFVFYALVGGLLIDVPALDILNETIRNLFYHVTSWFAMVALFIGGFVYSIKYLGSGSEKDPA